MLKKGIIYLFVVHLSLTGCTQKSPVTDEPQAIKTAIGSSVYNPDTVFTNLDRFEKEIRKFENLDKENGIKKGNVLFVGSSSIRLWKTLEEDFAPLPVINRGFGGATMPEVIYYFHRIIFPYKPSVMVVYAGENDISFDNGNVDAAISSLQKFIQLTKENLPLTRLIFISIKPSPKRWKFKEKFNLYNEKARALIDETPGFRFVNICPKMLNSDSLPKKELFREDSLHLNSMGYKLWKAELNPIVQEEFKKSKSNIKH